MWFKCIGYLLAASSFFFVLLAVILEDRVYDWLKEQMYREKRSWFINLMLAFGAALIGVTWYATLFHYVPYGWIVTVLVSLAVIKIVGFLFFWRKTADLYLRLVGYIGPPYRLGEPANLLFGVLFLLLAALVY